MQLFIKYYQKIIEPVLLGNNTVQEGMRGFAPCMFTKNSAESTNAIIKRWTGGKKLKVDELCMVLKEGPAAQFEKIEERLHELVKEYIFLRSKM